jgi:hypothetical protein
MNEVQYILETSRPFEYGSPGKRAKLKGNKKIKTP